MDPMKTFQLAALDRVVRSVGTVEDVGPARAALSQGLSSLSALDRDATIRYLNGSPLAEDWAAGRRALSSILGPSVK